MKDNNVPSWLAMWLGSAIVWFLIIAVIQLALRWISSDPPLHQRLLVAVFLGLLSTAASSMTGRLFGRDNDAL